MSISKRYGIIHSESLKIHVLSASSILLYQLLITTVYSAITI